MCLDKLYIGTNTKMYKTIKDTESFLEALDKYSQELSDEPVKLFVIPSYTSLQMSGEMLSKSKIQLGAQNMCWEDYGEFTGEISPLMLKEVGVKIVEIGHSERRHVLGEDDYQENKKVKCALRHGFTPLLCIGETLQQKENNISDEVLSTQLKIGLNGVNEEQAKSLWIAYEPVWSIGAKGIPATKEYANEKHILIKNVLSELFGKDIGSSIPVLYGGSVNNNNAEELTRMPYVDGLFVGRSAWDADNFNKIINMAITVFKEKAAQQSK